MFNKNVDKSIILLIAILFLGTIILWITLSAEILNHLNATENIKEYTSKNILFIISIFYKN